MPKFIIGATLHPSNDTVTRQGLGEIIRHNQLYRVTSSAALNFDFHDSIARIPGSSRHYAEDYTQITKLSELDDFERTPDISPTYETLAICEDIDDPDEVFWNLSLRVLDTDLIELDRTEVLRNIVNDMGARLAVRIDNFDAVVDDGQDPTYWFQSLAQGEFFPEEPDDVVCYIQPLSYSDFWDITINGNPCELFGCSPGATDFDSLSDDWNWEQFFIYRPFLDVAEMTPEISNREAKEAIVSAEAAPRITIKDDAGLFEYALDNWDLDDWNYPTDEFLTEKWS